MTGLPPKRAQTPARLPPDVNRCLFVKNLPFKITNDQMYELFGKFGAIRQIRMGTSAHTRGRAYVVFENIFDAKQAVEHLSGFNVGGRYIIVLYHNLKADKEKQKPTRMDLQKKKDDIEKLKKTYKVSSEDESSSSSSSSSSRS